MDHPPDLRVGLRRFASLCGGNTNTWQIQATLHGLKSLFWVTTDVKQLGFEKQVNRGPSNLSEPKGKGKEKR